MKRLEKFKNLLFAGLVPTCGAGGCGWSDLFKLGDNILNWLIMIAVPVAALAIAYAGWLFIWGSTNSGSRSRANAILRSVLIGLGATLAAALIVKAILSFLANAPFSNLIS